LYKVKGKVKREQKKIDYTLRVRVGNHPEPVSIALIEAKKNTLPPGQGLQQAKDYAKRLNVPFVYSSNGYRFVEYDDLTGLTFAPRIWNTFLPPKGYRQAKG
jgi:type I restriction enzyme R subunit